MSVDRRAILFTDDELKEMVWAAHNYTRPGQSRKEIKAQGTSCQKIDAESRYRARLAKEKENPKC